MKDDTGLVTVSFCSGTLFECILNNDLTSLIKLGHEKRELEMYLIIHSFDDIIATSKVVVVDEGVSLALICLGISHDLNRKSDSKCRSIQYNLWCYRIAQRCSWAYPHRRHVISCQWTNWHPLLYSILSVYPYWLWFCFQKERLCWAWSVHSWNRSRSCILQSRNPIWDESLKKRAIPCAFLWHNLLGAWWLQQGQTSGFEWSENDQKMIREKVWEKKIPECITPIRFLLSLGH